MKILGVVLWLGILLAGCGGRQERAGPSNPGAELAQRVSADEPAKALQEPNAGRPELPPALRTPPAAVDLADIDRTIAKEPAYKSQSPKYCLLVLGPMAKTRAWLVLDDDVLYVDCNGNGDLTEPGECPELGQPGADRRVPFEIVEIADSDGKNRHKLLCYRCGWLQGTNGAMKSLRPSLYVSYNSQDVYSTAVTFADSPEDAPVVHVAGPLQMRLGRGTPLRKTRKIGGYLLSAVVGTRGLGASCSLRHDAIPRDVHPLAVLEFPGRTPDSPPAVVETVLNRRC